MRSLIIHCKPPRAAQGRVIVIEQQMNIIILGRAFSTWTQSLMYLSKSTGMF